jgi:ubiquinone/menaquinone biosynthesis C-methylase UbiE
MLEDLRARGARRRVMNIVAAEGNAEQLPYGDGAFDAAYLITVLGEIPHPDQALRELRRVVKPAGRIIVGELFIDPDYVSPSRMRQLAAGAGLVFGAQTGSALSYFARLDVPSAVVAGGPKARDHSTGCVREERQG